MEITMLKGKIHRATVVEAKLDYVGSITVDEDLLDASGILEYEQVQIVDVNNGSRFETYTIAGKRGSGMICLNGAAARCVSTGDKIIIMAYARMSPEEARQNPPRVVFVDERNVPYRVTRYEKHGSLVDMERYIVQNPQNPLQYYAPQERPRQGTVPVQAVVPVQAYQMNQQVKREPEESPYQLYLKQQEREKVVQNPYQSYVAPEPIVEMDDTVENYYRRQEEQKVVDHDEAYFQYMQKQGLGSKGSEEDPVEDYFKQQETQNDDDVLFRQLQQQVHGQQVQGQQVLGQAEKELTPYERYLADQEQRKKEKEKKTKNEGYDAISKIFNDF